MGRPETENATFENAAILSRQGVPIAIRSGFESYVPKARARTMPKSSSRSMIGFDVPHLLPVNSRVLTK